MLLACQFGLEAQSPRTLGLHRHRRVRERSIDLPARLRSRARNRITPLRRVTARTLVDVNRLPDVDLLTPDPAGILTVFAESNGRVRSHQRHRPFHTFPEAHVPVAGEVEPDIGRGQAFGLY